MTSTEPNTIAQCRCGHARNHHMVSAEGEYSFTGWLALMFGISARPVRVVYRCRRCEEIVEATTDPDVLGKHY